MKRFLVLLLLVVAAITFFFFWASSAHHNAEEHTQLIALDLTPNKSENDSVYGILTYNIGYLSGMTNNLAVDRTQKLFDDNLDLVKSVMKSVQPDIVALQEIDYESKRSFYVNQQQALAQLGYPFVGQAVNWDEKYLPFPYWPITQHFGRVYSGQSILSRFQLSEHKSHVLTPPDGTPFWRSAFYLNRLAQVATVHLGASEIKVINVHMEAFDKEGRDLQTKEVVTLYKKYAKTQPVLLVGDFNSDLDNNDATVKKIASLPGIAYAVTDLNQKTYPSAGAEKRLDYIFYNAKFLEKVDARIVDEMGEASDHLPVMMRFQMKK